MTKEILAALDIGTKYTKLVVGSYDADGKLNILIQKHIETRGVRKGVVRDIPAVVEGVQQVCEACHKAGYTISTVSANFSTAEVKSFVRNGLKTLTIGQSISEDDIIDAQTVAYSESTDEQEVINRFKMQCNVDGRKVSNPIGMSGQCLYAGVLEVIAPKSILESIRSVINKAGLREDQLQFSAVADIEAVLTKSDRQNGAMVLNFGDGTLDYAVVSEGVIMDLGTIAVGGSHLTNDLAMAFNVQMNVAEKMKLEKGAATLQANVANDRYAISSSFLKDSNSTVSVHSIQTVTTERINELFIVLRDYLIQRGVQLQHLHSGIFLTGGASELPLLVEHVRETFGLNCQVGVLQDVKGLDAEMQAHPCAYTTAIGLLKLSARMMDQQVTPSLWARILKFLKG